MACVRIKSMCLYKGSFVKYFSAKATVRRRIVGMSLDCLKMAASALKPHNMAELAEHRMACVDWALWSYSTANPKDVFEKLCLWQRKFA